jgi:hypothetical protein
VEVPLGVDPKSLLAIGAEAAATIAPPSADVPRKALEFRHLQST